jgi:DNA invertase Pin-like site-specific DNA recombinase
MYALSSFGTMKVGYARVSTADQNLDLQIKGLKKVGCKKIFKDEGVSGAKADRPGLQEAIDYVRAGDQIVVWKLDRLGRSLPHLIKTVESFAAEGIEFQSISENIDTSTPSGRLFFHIMASIAQFERELIQERTQAGLAAARARGRTGGRPKALTPAQEKRCQELSLNYDLGVPEICKMVGCSRSAYYRAIAPKS